MHHNNYYYDLNYNLQGYQSTVQQTSYTAHEFENEVITKDNIEEMIYARRVKDNKTLTQVLIAASVVCFWWPFSLICLAAAYYTSEKVATVHIPAVILWFILIIIIATCFLLLLFIGVSNMGYCRYSHAYTYATSSPMITCYC